MNIKKDDILYRYDWKDRSDKDYCTDEYNDGTDCYDCPIYKKCQMQSQKLVITKVTITNRTFYKYIIPKRIQHYNAVDLKNWREPVGNFRNTSHYKTNIKINPEDIDNWAKSEKGALVKVNTRLKEFIKMIRKTDKSWYQTDKRNIENFKKLQEKISLKIKESNK